MYNRIDLIKFYIYNFILHDMAGQLQHSQCLTN